MTDPIIAAAQFLAGHVEYARHQQWADEFLADVEACSRVVRSIVRGPVAQRYLGPCGAYPFDEDNNQDDVLCVGDVYAREGAQNGACRDCGATVGTAERRAWLDAEVRSQAFRASEIEDAYAVPAGTIRVWATRGVLSVHGHDLQGRALYLLSEVLDVAASRAAQRATEQAKRARRAAVRAESEDAA